MELQKAGERVYYIPGPVNTGIIVGDEGIVCVDTGLDRSSAKKILKAAEELGKPLRGVIITHPHADHFGGNEFIVSKTGAEVFAPHFDEAIIRYPLYEPIFLFNGASPVRELRNKFLLGPPSEVAGVLAAGPVEIAGIPLEVVPLPGHTLGQVGIAVENVLFTGDAFFSVETTMKHGIPFFADIGLSIETLMMLAETGYSFYIPGHGPAVEEIKEIAGVNIRVLREISDMVLDITKPLTSGDILTRLCDRMGVNITSATQYYLLLAGLMAHLAYLKETDRIEIIFSDNQMLWRKKE